MDAAVGLSYSELFELSLEGVRSDHDTSCSVVAGLIATPLAGLAGTEIGVDEASFCDNTSLIVMNEVDSLVVACYTRESETCTLRTLVYIVRNFDGIILD